MPATIVQTNTTPFTRVPIDPVTLDIIENALRNARRISRACLSRRRCPKTQDSANLLLQPRTTFPRPRTNTSTQ